VKSYRKELTLEIPTRMSFVNITPDVEDALKTSGIQEGLCLVNAMHITASVFINDDESGLHKDFAAWLERLAPTSRRRLTDTTSPERTMATRISNVSFSAAKRSSR